MHPSAHGPFQPAKFPHFAVSEGRELDDNGHEIKDEEQMARHPDINTISGDPKHS